MLSSHFRPSRDAGYPPLIFEVISVRCLTVALLLPSGEPGSRTSHDPQQWKSMLLLQARHGAERRAGWGGGGGTECSRKWEQAALGAISERVAQSDFREVIN